MMNDVRGEVRSESWIEAGFKELARSGVEGVRVVRATFGLLADQANRVTLLRNEVEGNARQTRGLRGDVGSGIGGRRRFVLALPLAGVGAGR